MNNPWYEIYKLIADLLCGFYKKHGDQSPQLLLDKLKSNGDYMYASPWLRQAIEKYDAKGVDPIQLFASFNNSSSSTGSKLHRIKKLLEVFEINTDIHGHEHYFDGCPSPMSARLINARSLESQQDIWRVFYKVASEGIDGLTEESFNRYNNWFGVNYTGFTIFLYWINSEQFMPMDKNTASFLVGTRILESIPRNFHEYFTFCSNNLDGSLFRDIVSLAYHGVNEEFLMSPSLQNFLRKHEKQNLKEQDFLNYLTHENFKLIAIRPLQKSKHTKNIELNQLYQFYHNYRFDEETKEIHYEQTFEDELYNGKGIEISIAAIVGKNGSGKSTLTELLFLIINRLAYEKVLNQDYPLVKEEISAELFFKTDQLYKLSIINDKITIETYQYDSESSKYHTPFPVSFQNFHLDNFFYSIVLNYSLYGLNKRVVGKWIDPLFHKNDGYQTPIVLNPKRTEGKIDINIEEYLTKSRCLSNILEPTNIDFENKIVSELTPQKIPKTINCKLNSDKIKNLYKYIKNQEIEKEYIDEVISKLFLYLNLKKNDSQHFDDARNYLFQKLISITETYPKRYGKFSIFKKDKFVSFQNLPDFFRELFEEDNSHITFKIKQTVNYIRYNHIQNSNNVLRLSEDILRIQQEHFEETKKEIKTIELIPPPIFLTDITFKNGGSFGDLSSGEKQYVFSLNTITYHLFNLDSIDRDSLFIRYNYINVLFDEIELCFHPDMQRSFIYDLLKMIKSLKLEKISGLNILFATHSPFILSDISEKNVLHLKNGQKIDRLSKGTFAANLHDLLHDNFFLEDGFMGKFAQEKINEVIRYLTYRINQKRLKDEFNSSNLFDFQLLKKMSLEKENEYLEKIGVLEYDSDSYIEIIQLINEPLLKSKLLEMHTIIKSDKDLKNA
jgi:energy-coupling factor transporter ATP-binding protein EcfA2